MRRHKKIPASDSAPGMVFEMPIISTEVQLGTFQTTDGPYGIMNCSTALNRGTYALDRSQCLRLGAELIKLGRKLPSLKEQKKIEVPHPEGEKVLGSGLVLPA